jgi:hypothetical protein
MSDSAQRAWRFYLDDMIAFAEKVIAYTNGIDQWRELIILAAGVARPKEAAKFLRRLVERGQKLKGPDLRHRVLLLAIAC